jgi:4-alpha-glucanotransferase
VSNENSLLDDNLDTASGNAGTSAEGDSSKQNEELTPGKKAAKKKASKVTGEPIQAENPDAVNPLKQAIKKASPKKAIEKKEENIEPKPAKIKTIAAKKPGGNDQEASKDKPTTKKQPSAGKQKLVKELPVPANEDIAAEDTSSPINSAAEKQDEVKEDAITPPLSAPDQQPDVLTSAITEGQPVTEQSVTENPEATAGPETIEPAIEEHNDVEEKLHFPDNEEPSAVTGQQENLEKPLEVAEIPLVEQPSAAAEKTIAVPEDWRLSSKSGLRKITFQVRFYTHPGQSLYVTGKHSLLGDNNFEKAFPLNYLNAEYWSGSLEIPDSQQLSEDISYKYILKNNDDTITEEWGEDKVIQPLQYTAKEVLLADSWNASSFIENTFYTEPFQQVLLKDNFTEVESKQPPTVTHIFRAKTPLLAKGQTLCMTGSLPELGQWDTAQPVLLSRKEDEVWYSVSLDLSGAAFPFSYKYGVYNINTNKFLGYEDGKNRVLFNNASPEKLTVVSDGLAVLPPAAFKGAGVAIPVFSLKSENSFGAGEFTDLKLLVDWAKEVGLKLIQILPVNDTTATHTFSDSYPYAAISAFALHALYLHLPSIADDENQSLITSFEEKRQELNSKADVDYVGVMAAKWSFIKQVFPSQKQPIFESADFKSFFEENASWLVPYAAFSYFREKYNTADFNQWPDNQSFDAEQINKLAASPLEADEELSIYFYVQFHLHLQLKEATDYAHKNGIILKGDIPIGIYRNSCDAWQEPFLFNMDMQAGAPPDDFAVKGQNWGFPTYNWQKMREDGFTWWKNRFKQMSYYFDAFRIDHILGFFRIWSIPMDAIDGIMGHFVPAVPVTINEFTDMGISFDRDRLCIPFINQNILKEIFGDDAESVQQQFIQASSDGSLALKPEFNTQKKAEAHSTALEQTELNKKIKSGLFELISNVILFEAEGSEGKAFHFRIAMDSTSSFRQLDGHTQYALKELYVNYFYRRQDSFWQKEAMQKLPELKRSTNMLICGEDLGMVPDCVPGVMKELAILSLEIQRMPKDPKREFFHPNDAPYLSVVTSSTHDMSTVRGWWEEDRTATQRFFVNELGQWGTAPYFCEPWINKIIVIQHLYSPAMWSIFQLQDLLGIDAILRRENPHEERINIPADPKHYWRYRMHRTLEALIKESRFTAELKGYIAESGR